MLKLFRKGPGDTFNIDKLSVEEARQEAKEKAWRDAKRAKGTPESFRLRYTGSEPAVTNGTRIHLVPLPGKDLHVHLTPEQIKKDICPTCRVVHPVKTIHLWLDSSNTVLVSRGVKESIEKDYPGGLEAAELMLDGGTTKPPELKVGDGKNRREIDQENEAIRHWS